MPASWSDSRWQRRMTSRQKKTGCRLGDSLGWFANIFGPRSAVLPWNTLKQSVVSSRLKTMAAPPHRVSLLSDEEGVRMSRKLMSLYLEELPADHQFKQRPDWFSNFTVWSYNISLLFTNHCWRTNILVGQLCQCHLVTILQTDWCWNRLSLTEVWKQFEDESSPSSCLAEAATSGTACPARCPAQKTTHHPAELRFQEFTIVYPSKCVSKCVVFFHTVNLDLALCCLKIAVLGWTAACFSSCLRSILKGPILHSSVLTDGSMIHWW